MNIAELTRTVKAISQSGKGILAADESFPTIQKRFDNINIPSTDENRQAYRDLLFTTPNVNEFISGVILFEETLFTKAINGTPFPKLLSDLGIVPGIKVDKGTVPLENANGEKITEGLDGLVERLQEYKKHGAKFAKWRAVFNISDKTPSDIAIRLNAVSLASYASICQHEDIVPIVEPEILIDGKHTIEECAEKSGNVLSAVFQELREQKVLLENIILKPSMVISGKECPQQASIDAVAAYTLAILRETVPAAVQTINFLSGGQSPELATAHLNAMNASEIEKPWNLSFSYGRALQEPALTAWKGKAENIEAAQQAFYKRAKLNSAACLGQYMANME